MVPDFESVQLKPDPKRQSGSPRQDKTETRQEVIAEVIGSREAASRQLSPYFSSSTAAKLTTLCCARNVVALPAP